MQVSSGLSPAQRAWATRQANAAASVGAIAQVAVHRTARAATIDVAFPNGEAFELYVNARGSNFKLTGTDKVKLASAVYPHLAAKPGESLRDRIYRIAAAARKSATLAQFVARLSRAA